MEGDHTVNGNNIKSGEEIVKEFFKKVKKDSNLDKDTREALFELFQQGNLKKASINKKLDSIRNAALGEENDEIKEDQD
jgi:hypothetical protein